MPKLYDRTPVDNDIFDSLDVNEHSFSLSKLKKMVEMMEEKYGKNAVVVLDAGYNNICWDIRPSKQI